MSNKCLDLLRALSHTVFMSNKHRAEVIEVYENEGKAAVRFSLRGRERVECVSLYLGPSGEKLVVGMKGWTTYTVTPNMGIWGFTPSKKQMQEVA
jgi:hypothetical protein